MLGKMSNAAVRPTALGMTSQSSVYGSAIPTIIGRTRASMSMIWAANLRTGPSGKKGKSGGGKKSPTAPTYVENVDLLLGTNPIISPLQIQANQNDSFLLDIGVPYGRYVTTRSTGSPQIISWTDTKFYCIIGVTITINLIKTIDDYGSGGEVTLGMTGPTSDVIAERPLWNAATAGPNPTDPSANRYWPFVYYWLPGQGPSIEIPALELGLLDEYVVDPSNITINIYYARIPLNQTLNPAARLNMHFENVLGDGDEYSTNFNDSTQQSIAESQQILYPAYAGLGAAQLDVGASGGAMPDLRIEVLGSFPVYSSGDADFTDMISCIFREAQCQAGYGSVPTRTILQRGLQCYEYPGTTQKKACTSADASKTPMTGPQFDLGSNDSSIMIVTASAASGWSAAATISDEAGHAWTPTVPDHRTAQRQLWYALATGSTPRNRNQVSLNLAGANGDVQLLEISGLDSAVLDSSMVVQSTGTAGALQVQASITTTNDIGLAAYILAWVFASSPQDPSQWTLRGPAKQLIIPQSNSLQRADYRIVKFPGTYTFTYDLPSEITTDQEYTVVLLAFKATQPASYAAPLGDVLDQYWLDQCMLQNRANGMWGSVNMDSQKAAADWAKDIISCMTAAPVWSGFKLKLIPLSEVSAINNGAFYIAPTSTGPVADLSTENGDFVGDENGEVIKVPRKGVPSLQNVFHLQHPNRSSYYVDINESLPDAGSLANYGTRNDAPQDLRMVQDSRVAQKLLGLMTRVNNAPSVRNTITFTLQPKWGLFEPMDLITITDPVLGFDHVPVRLTSCQEKGPEDNNGYAIECEAIPFIYGLNSPVEAETTDHVPYTVDKNQIPASVNAPVFIECTEGLAERKDVAQLWIGVSDSDTVYGGCQVWVSTDGGISYKLLGVIDGNCVTGNVATDWPLGVDPETVNDLVINLAESNGLLETYDTTDEDHFAYPCIVAGADPLIPYEVIAYADALETSTNHFTLKATGGHYLRRGVYDSPCTDHPVNSRFAFCDPAGTGLLKVTLPPEWVGLELKFKFAAFNSYKAGTQDLADCTVYSFTPLGVVLLDSKPPSGGSSLVALTHIDDANIPINCASLKWNLDNQDNKTILGSAIILSATLPCQGPTAAQRAAWPDSVLETGTCIITDGSKSVTGLTRASNINVKGRVFVIFTTGDNDMDGEVIVSEGVNSIKLTRAFNKSGSYNYAIIKRFWDKTDSNNLDYIWYSKDQMGDPTAVSWRTPNFPIAPGIVCATVFEHNLLGIDAGLTVSGIGDSGVPAGASGLNVIISGVDPVTGAGQGTIQLNRPTVNYKTIDAAGFYLAASLPAQGPMYAERVAHPTSVIVADVAGCTVEQGNKRVLIPGYAPVGGRTVVNRVLLFFDPTDGANGDLSLDGEVISGEGAGYIDLTVAPDHGGTLTCCVVKIFWDWRNTFTPTECSNTFYIGLNIPADLNCNPEDLVWTFVPKAMPGGSAYPTIYFHNRYGAGAEI